jgi:hypothetical protein
MGMMSAEEVRKEWVRRYNANPEGWRVLAGRDSRGYYDLVVLHGSELWLVKEYPLSPYDSVGFGVRERIDESEVLRRIRSTHPFGFRPLNYMQIEEMANAFRNEESVDRIVRGVMETKPVSLQNITSPVVMQGPIMHSSAPILSERQRELDQKLRSELESMLQRRHPHLLRQFI